MYGKGKTEFISAQIITKYGETETIVVSYVLPKAKKNWAKEEHEEIIENTLLGLEKII